MKKIASIVLGLTFMLTSPISAAPAVDLKAAVNNPQRTEANKVRDKYRHPLETLKYFGIKPTDHVVEVLPGGGYWTEILGPYLLAKGKYTAAVGDYKNSAQTFTDNFVSKPAIFGKITVNKFVLPDQIAVAPDNSADFVLTFRNVHNWMESGQTDKVFASFYKALKKGGILGIEEHRANNKSPQDPKAESGYMREDYIIEVAKKAGFKLVSKSEINANKKDTADHPEGVWTLPPSLALGEKDKAKYLAIGESDRMTLKFKK